MKRIVITGVGMLSPIGMSKDVFWKNLFDGKSNFKEISIFSTAGLPVKIAGEITEFNPKEILGKKGLVDLDRATMLLLAATKFALEDARIDAGSQGNAIGLSVGTTFGSLRSISEFDKEALIEGPRFVNPSRFPNTVMNSPAGRVAIRYGIKGFNSTLSTGMCAAMDALEYAVHSIRSGRAKTVIVGAVEELCPQIMAGFHKIGYLSGSDGEGRVISCPFDQRRNGIVFAEGSSVLIVEDLESASRRNAKIYAEIGSIDSNYTPFKMYRHSPDGRGMVSAMNGAIAKAQASVNEIDAVFANANSSVDADPVETKALKKVFGEKAAQVPVTAIKSIVGESFSASGGMGVAAAVGSMLHSIVPPTINYKDRDPLCDLDYTPNSCRHKELKNVLVNCFSPSGSHSSVVLKKLQ